jgi:hypothetical protein
MQNTLYLIMSVLTSTGGLKVKTKPLIIYKNQKEAAAIAQMESEIGVEHMEDGEYQKNIIIYPISVKQISTFYHVVFRTAVFEDGRLACNVCGIFKTKEEADQCYQSQSKGNMTISGIKAFVTIGNVSTRLSE